MPGTKKSPALTAPRGSNWLKEAAKRAVAAAADSIAKTGPRDGITVSVVIESKELGRTTQRRRLRDKIHDVVAGAAAMNSANVANARAHKD